MKKLKVIEERSCPKCGSIENQINHGFTIQERSGGLPFALVDFLQQRVRTLPSNVFYAVAL